MCLHIYARIYISMRFLAFRVDFLGATCTMYVIWILCCVMYKCVVHNWLNVKWNIVFLVIAVLIWSSDSELETASNYL